ncbi:MAG: hypothetical protein ACSLFN_10955 [Candidatus Limnocylindrales bacterium]
MAERLGWRDLTWAIAIIVGLAVGGFALHFPGSFGEATWQPAALVFGVILGAAHGVAVGALLWLALGLPRSTGKRLLVWMALGIGATHGLHDGAPASLGAPLVALLSGVALAAAYAWAMSDRRPRIVGVVGVGWAVGLMLAVSVGGALGLPWSETPIGWSTDHAVDGIVVGLVWAIATIAAGVPRALRGDRGAMRATTATAA